MARGAVVSIGLIVMLAWPDRDSAVTAKILGVVVLAAAVTAIATERRFHMHDRDARRAHFARVALLTVVGLVLVIWPTATVTVVGRLIGGGLVLLGVSGAYRGATAEPGPERAWAIARGGMTAGFGLLALAVPERVAIFVLIGLVLAWAAQATVAVVALLTDARRPDRSAGSAWAVTRVILMEWLARFEMEQEHRELMTRQLYFEGAALRARLFRFGVLIALSTTIAALGIIVDSTAVVVGAMLIAPLMTPIMAAAAALAMAWPGRALRSLATVLGGVVLSVAVAWVLTGLFPQASELILSSSQISSRINPTLIDLLIALTAGAAGAFAFSRPDVSDSLPGVAIAVALVPPLAVAGIALQLRVWGDVAGAFLLFLTNLVAIILAGGVVFLLTGFTPVGRLRTRGSEVRRSIAVVAVIMTVIAIPLVLSGQRLLADSAAYDEAQSAVHEWTSGTDLALVEIDISGPEVRVTVAGGDPPGSIEVLGELMERALSRDVELNVVVVPTIELSYTTDG